MTDKAQKIREEVERLQKRAEHNLNTSLTENERQFWLGESSVLTLIGKYIDTMQEEPVSDELEKAAEQDVCEVVNTCSGTGIPNDHIPSWVQDAMINEFIHGANWQKEQDQSTIELAEDHAMLAGMEKMKEKMMAKVVDGYVIEDIEEGNGDFLLSAEYLPKSMGLKDRQKVKVIVIKED